MRSRLLIVEDDVDQGHLMRQDLELHHFQVMHAYNGQEAWRLIQESDFEQ